MKHSLLDVHMKTGVLKYLFFSMRPMDCHKLIDVYNNLLKIH